MAEKLQGTLFDIEDAVESNKAYFASKAEQRRADFYGTLVCPCEGEPKDDNERMKLDQWKWLKNGDEEARDRFFKLGFEVLRNVLYAEKKKRSLYLSDEQDLDVIATAFDYVFRRYTKGDGYYVHTNMIKVLQGGIRHALEYRTMADDEISLDGIKGDYTHKVTRVF